MADTDTESEVVNNVFPAGRKVYINEVDIYERWYSKKPARVKKGNYYIYSSIIKNDRIRICRLADHVDLPGKMIGWVDIYKLADNDNLVVGDKVNVTGVLFQYADGTGNDITKYRAEMYITDILDPAEFPYSIGVTTKSTSGRLAFARPDMISRYIAQPIVKYASDQTIVPDEYTDQDDDHSGLVSYDDEYIEEDENDNNSQGVLPDKENEDHYGLTWG